MREAVLEGLLLLDLRLLLLIFATVVFAQIIAVLPGLGGIFAVVILIPFVIDLEPLAGIAILVAALVTSGTGNSVTAILFGVPGTATGIATTFDGYPLAKQGQAGRAMGAALASSAVGGLIGALVLAFAIPLVRPLVLLVGPAEFSVLIFVSMLFIANVANEDFVRSLMMGFLGFVVSIIGRYQGDGTQRYTLDIPYLYDGIRLVPMMIGMYAIAEMIRLTQRRGSIADAKLSEKISGGMFSGVADVLRYWRATLESSLVGLGIGVVPGMGGDVASFMAYSRVQRIAKQREMFGSGAIEGVIAADASQNSKEGGAFIPTLAFGVPGSAGMAVLLAAFTSIGVFPGEQMFTTNLDIFWMIMWVLVLANVLGAVLVMSVVNPLAKLTLLDTRILIPPIVVISIFGSYATTQNAGDIIVTIVFGIAGFLMVIHGYSRTTFTIGFVLGYHLERQFLFAEQLYTFPGIFQRPAVQAILAVFAVALLPKLLRWVSGRGKRDPGEIAEERMNDSIGLQAEEREK